jgi:cytochrome c oxidase subunit 1
MLAVTFSFVMLVRRRRRHHQHELSAERDGAQHAVVTGHFHLIFGGAIVIMYMVIAYERGPHTGCAPLRGGAVKVQLWLWFIGMLVLTMPWHLVGLPGCRGGWRYYSNPVLQPQAWTVTMSTVGGLVLVVSTVLFVYILARARRVDAAPAPFTFSLAAHAGERTPAALNTFGLWVAMMIGLTIVNYGYPIAQLAMLKETSVPVIQIGGP